MDSKTAIESLHNLAFAVLQHTYIKNGETALAAKGMQVDEAGRQKMQDIKFDAMATLRENATIVLKEILKREPTAKEIQVIASVLDDASPSMSSIL